MLSKKCSYMQVVAVALLVVFVSRILFKPQQKLNLPPGPTALPIIGCLHLLGKQPHRSFADLAQKYGPIMSVQLGQKYYVIATSPEVIKEFLKEQDANFTSRPYQYAAEILFPKGMLQSKSPYDQQVVLVNKQRSHGQAPFQLSSNQGVITLSDVIVHDITPVNRHLKKILVSELMSAKRLESSKYIRTEETAYMLSSIAQESNRPIRVKTHINIMSTNIVSRMVLNKRFLGGEEQSDVSKIHEFMGIVEEMTFCMGAIHLQDVFNFIPQWFDPQGLDTRFRKLRTRMDVFYRNVIDEHRENRRKNPVSEGEETLLDVLLKQLNHPEYGVTEEHINGVIWVSNQAVHCL